MEQKKQTKFIMGKREIGKIVMCLIIAIIMLSSLKTIATTIIAGSAEVIEDEKTIVRTAASVSRGASSSNKVELASLTTELGRYASTTVTQISSEILQVKFNRTGNIYEINVNIGPTFDVTGTIPYLPAGYTPVANTDLETGFVIEDEDGNQFVWVEVPRTTTVYPTAGINITSFNDTAYNKIEADLRAYTTDYREGVTYTDENSEDRENAAYVDTWLSEASTGLTEAEYYKLKKKMLKSIYKNGGFYVGRYETGIDYDEGPKRGGITQTPVIKQNAYPYNSVTVAQAQQLSESFATTGYTTSLMFGVQRYLIFKYMETKGIPKADLNTDSTDWGNYQNSVFNITNTNAKYAIEGGYSTWVDGAYGQKSAGTRVLLSTGSSETFKKQNIYDLAGNVGEWLLEQVQCSMMGNLNGFSGYWAWDGDMYPASATLTQVGTNQYAYGGFRVCLYKDETDNTKTPTYIPEGYTHIAGDMDSGYVIADPGGNEYVWVEVPRTTTVYPTAGTNITTFTSTAYDKIIKDLKSYTSAYSGSNDRDIYYSDEATGLTENEYNMQKNKMLQSIYKNGGFYVGRYETGIDYSEGPRTASGNTNQTPVIKRNAYPYIYVSVPQSQELSESIATTGYTTSLMFDMQWNLTMKYLENKGVTEDELLVDSKAWGNFRDNLYNITNTNAKYSTNAGSTWSSAPYSKTSATSVLLTTGASDTFSKQNIYDLAGNEYEWTLGVFPNDEDNIQRGNFYDTSTITYAAAVYGSANFGVSNATKGFRVALYKDETNAMRVPTYIPEGYTHVAGDMDSGYVIADASGNEYVWVEVPKTATVYPTAGLSITNFTDAEYTKIENDLHTYTRVYRNGTTATDTWSSLDATGFTESEYNIQKKKMLKSIYKNGGFYVGRYETGIDYSEGARMASTDQVTQTPVIKPDAYPYNFVTVPKAQELSERFETTGYETSLMFGIQWDLILKYFETSGVAVQSELTTDSTDWGNYYNNRYNITKINAKYNIRANSDAYLIQTEWLQAPYQKNELEDKTMLTTGASDSFAKQNIYDLAGNLWEWTLEYSPTTGEPSMSRGGDNGQEGSGTPANYRSDRAIDSMSFVSFRVSLYKDE